MILASTCRLRSQGLMIVLFGVRGSLFIKINKCVLIHDYASEQWTGLASKNIWNVYCGKFVVEQMFMFPIGSKTWI